MIFDLHTAHMGDILMAMPAMRSTDAAIVRDQDRFPGSPVAWLARGEATATIWPAPRRGRHTTDAWLESTGRGPVRHRLLPPAEKRLTLLLPAVAVDAKRWHHWAELQRRLEGAVIVDGTVPRDEWMSLLNNAATVVCPDTGTAHMADALGCPQVVALHGIPANWPHCAPYWERRYCIARDSMAAITVDDVLEVVRG